MATSEPTRSRVVARRTRAERDPKPTKPVPEANAATAQAAQMRAMHARLAAHVRWAKEDPVKGTQAARDGFQQRFYNEVDAAAGAAGEVLTSAERERRAESAKKAHMTRLALKSAQARRRRSSR